MLPDIKMEAVRVSASRRQLSSLEVTARSFLSPRLASCLADKKVSSDHKRDFQTSLQTTPINKALGFHPVFHGESCPHIPLNLLYLILVCDDYSNHTWEHEQQRNDHCTSDSNLIHQAHHNPSVNILTRSQSSQSGSASSSSGS
jgi:hypothetical protein